MLLKQSQHLESTSSQGSTSQGRRTSEQLRQLQKENAELKEKAAAAAAGDIFKDVKEVNGHRYIASQVSVSDAGALRTFADNWKQKDYSDLLVLVAAIGDKVNVLVASKTKDLHAGNLVKELAPNRRWTWWW